jgi:hypothetical protein
LKVNRRTTIRAAIALSALVAGIVIAPSAALAQTAAADQYLPGTDTPGGGQAPEGGGGGGGQNPAGGGGGGGQEAAGGGDEAAAGGGAELSPSAGTGEADAGTLPFTGYPLTALLLVVIVLLVAGLLVRFGPEGLNRLRGADGTTR